MLESMGPLSMENVIKSLEGSGLLIEPGDSKGSGALL